MMVESMEHTITKNFSKTIFHFYYKIEVKNQIPGSIPNNRRVATLCSDIFWYRSSGVNEMIAMVIQYPPRGNHDIRYIRGQITA